jgi:hypothetical protein
MTGTEPFLSKKRGLILGGSFAERGSVETLSKLTALKVPAVGREFLQEERADGFSLNSPLSLVVTSVVVCVTCVEFSVLVTVVCCSVTVVVSPEVRATSVVDWNSAEV